MIGPVSLTVESIAQVHRERVRAQNVAQRLRGVASEWPGYVAPLPAQALIEANGAAMYEAGILFALNALGVNDPTDFGVIG